MASLGQFLVQPPIEQEVEVPEECSTEFVHEPSESDGADFDDVISDEEKSNSRVGIKVFELLKASKERKRQNRQSVDSLYKHMSIQAYERTLHAEALFKERGSKLDVEV